MAKQTYLYEVLIRGNPDGTVKGAHMLYMERFTDDATGELIVEKEGVAEPLDPAAVESLLGKEMAKAGEQVVTLAAERDAAQSRLAAANRLMDELTKVLSGD